MRIVFGAPRSLLLAVAFLQATGGPSRAQPRDEDLFIRPEDQRTVLFGSLDAGRSVFVSGGSKQSLTGSLDRPGFVVMESSGYGLTHERLRLEGLNLPAERLKYQGSLLAGWQSTFPALYVAAYAGPEIRWDQLAYAGHVARLSKPRQGGRAQLEIWSNPTPDTLLTATVTSGTARAEVWARVSAGLKVWGDAFVGPEATFYATPTYGETRFGGHVTGIPVGILELRVSGGWQHDDAHRNGTPYGSFSAWMRL